ncbi:MAG: hypothetical protein FWH37_02490 [Candidatus Bathyarchaeota archaeon]|nr:hypothetical protein [Candidatus Termiticorpusculum sp.]
MPKIVYSIIHNFQLLAQPRTTVSMFVILTPELGYISTWIFGYVKWFQPDMFLDVDLNAVNKYRCEQFLSESVTSACYYL